MGDIETSGAFPVSRLPMKVQSIINDFNQENGFPTAYFSSAVLFAVSVAIGSTVKLAFPYVGDVYGNVCMAIVGRRGTNKSAPVLEAIKPLLMIDHQYVKAYSAAYKEYERQRAKGECPDPPISSRVMVQDITTEMLLEKLDENPRGLGLYVDELASWISGFDRYRKSSSSVDEPLFLSFYNCSPITVDRKSKKGAISLALPYLSIIGSIQPEVLDSVISRNRIQNGFFDRLLITTEEEYEFYEWKLEEDLPTDVRSRWEYMLVKIFNLSLHFSDSAEKPTIIPTDKAKQWIITWRNMQEERNLQNGNPNQIALFKKTQMYGLRLALLLNILYYASGEIDDPLKLDFQVAVNATIIADWFYQNSLAFLDDNKSSEYDGLSPKESAFVSALPLFFSTKDAIQIGDKFGMKQRTVNKFLSDKNGIATERLTHGQYHRIDLTLPNV